MNEPNKLSMTYLKSGIGIFVFSLSTFICSAQSSNDFMLSGAVDLLKTDYYNFFDKAQVGFEGNYFVVRQFAATAGVEFWSQQRNSFVIGMRWYPQDHFFVRFRGLIGENEAAIGGGWAKPINETLRFEAIGDFYLKETEFAIRAGISYIFKNKKK